MLCIVMNIFPLYGSFDTGLKVFRSNTSLSKSRVDLAGHGETVILVLPEADKAKLIC